MLHLPQFPLPHFFPRCPATARRSVGRCATVTLISPLKCDVVTGALYGQSHIEIAIGKRSITKQLTLMCDSKDDMQISFAIQEILTLLQCMRKVVLV